MANIATRVGGFGGNELAPLPKPNLMSLFLENRMASLVLDVAIRPIEKQHPPLIDS